MARRHGKNGQVLMDPAGGTTYAELAAITKWSLDMATDKVAVTAFGDTNKVYVQGLPDIKGSLGFVWDSTDVTLVTSALAGDVVGLKLVPSTLDATAFFSGLAYIDASLDVDVNGAVTGAGSFVAADSWAIAP